MMKGQQMMLQALLKGLGISDTLAEQMETMIRTVAAFDAKMDRIERKLDILTKGENHATIGATDVESQSIIGNGTGTGVQGTTG